MAGRIRTIKPEMLEDAVIAELSDVAFRLFVGMILLADDAGRLRADSRYLAGQIFWARVALQEPSKNSPGVLPVDVARARTELEAGKIIQVYRVRGQEYAWIRNFNKHQRIDKPSAPKCPGPDEKDKAETPLKQAVSEEPKKRFQEPSETILGGLQESSGSPLGGKGREGNGTEGSGAEGGVGEIDVAKKNSPSTKPQAALPGVDSHDEGHAKAPGAVSTATKKRGRPKGSTNKSKPAPEAPRELPEGSLAARVRDAIAEHRILGKITAGPSEFAESVCADGAYPGVDVLAEIRRAAEYATRGKTKYTDGRRYLANWLRRAEEQAAERPKPAPIARLRGPDAFGPEDEEDANEIIRRIASGERVLENG